MGNVVATVKADSVVKNAPITQRHPAPAGAHRRACRSSRAGRHRRGCRRIRIRGTSSLSQSNEPLIVVDGIRYDNGTEPGNTSAGVRINRFQIDPEDIESIDIIKGPSASALYGTAAANGVIVIKTKRGTASAPRWSGFAEGGVTSMPTGKYPANYWSCGPQHRRGRRARHDRDSLHRRERGPGLVQDRQPVELQSVDESAVEAVRQGPRGRGRHPGLRRQRPS